MICLSSTNKTPYLRLSSWLGSDIPNRVDFNNDNNIVDSALGTHLEDEDIHVSAQEKAVWNQPYHISTYIGNGNSTRSLNLDCPFNPTWGIIFRLNAPVQTIDINNEADNNYFAIFTKNGSQAGVSLNNKSLTLMQSTAPIFGMEYRTYNEMGASYFVIAFR